MRRAEPHTEPDDRALAEDVPRLAASRVRFSGYCWNFGFIFVYLGAFLGFLFMMHVLGPTLSHRELTAPLFEVLDFEVSWFFLPIFIGGGLGLLTFLFWGGRTRITVDDRGIEIQGAIRHALIPWGEIEMVSISLKPGRRGPPMPTCTIHRDSAPYIFFVDLPRGTRRRFCDAIEARGIEVSNSFLAGASPAFGFLLLGLPALMLLLGL